MREQIKIDDTILSLIITDAVTKMELSIVDLCSIKKGEFPNFDAILNSENGLKEFEKFCIAMQEQSENLGFKIFSYEWKWKFAKAYDIFHIWGRLLSAKEVEIFWRVRDSHHYIDAPMRRIPLGSQNKNDKPLIWMEELDRNGG